MNYYKISFCWWGWSRGWKWTWGYTRDYNNMLNVKMLYIWVGPFSIHVGRDFGA